MGFKLLEKYLVLFYLDIDALKIVAKGVNKLKNKDNAAVLTTVAS